MGRCVCYHSGASEATPGVRTPRKHGYVQHVPISKGVALYKEDCIETNLESEAAVATFEEMTDLYILHGLPLAYDFINRFRTGEMPLGIASYVVHNTLAVFAPELRGQWGFVPVPGVMQEDGTINRTVPVNLTQLTTGNATAPQGTTGAIIMEKSEKKEQAWEFLKWWTRADTQVRFGREMEALIGAAARWPTANVEAMLQLPWNVEEREALLEQCTGLREFLLCSADTTSPDSLTGCSER